MLNKNHKILPLSLILVILSGSLFSCQFETSNNAPQQLEKARALAAKNYHGSALIELKGLLKTNATSVPALLMLDELNAELNQHEETIKFLSQARKAGVDDFRISFKLIKNYLFSKKYTLALSEIDQATTFTSSKNDQIALKILRARSYTGLGKLIEAEKIYSGLLDDQETLHYGETGLAELTLNKIKQQEFKHWSYINIHLPGEQYFLYTAGETPYIQQNTIKNLQLKEELNKKIIILRQLHKNRPDDIQITSLLGKAYYFSNRYTEAINFLNRSLAIDTRHSDSLFFLAKTNFQLGYHSAAKKNLEQILVNDKWDLETCNLLAALRIRDNEVEPTIDLLERFIKKGIKNEDLFINLGNLKLKTYDPEQAITAYTEASKIAPQSVYAKAMLGTAHLVAQKPGQALKMFTQARYLNPAIQPISTALIETNLLIREPLAALRISKTQTSKHPESPVSYHLLGTAYQQLGKKTSAIHAFERAITINPEYTPARIKLVEIYFDSRQTDIANRLLQEGLELDPKNSSLLIEKAVLEEKAGHPLAAREKLLSVIRKKPDNIQARILLGLNYLKTGHINEAMEVKKKLRIYDRYSTGVIAFNGAAFEALGNLENAESSFNKLVQQQPGNPEFLEHLGRVQSKTNDLETAQKTLKMASSLYHDQSLSTLVLLAELYTKQNNLKTAKEHIKKIQRLSPDSSEIDILRGDILVIEKRIPEAIESYKYGLEKSFKTTTVNKISRCYLMIDQQDKAVAYIKEWINLHPDDLNLSLSLIDIYRQAGNTSLAIEECLRIQKLQSENIWVLHQLAQLYKNRDNEQAYIFAKLAYSIGFDSPEITATYNQLAANYQH